MKSLEFYRKTDKAMESPIEMKSQPECIASKVFLPANCNHVQVFTTQL